MIDIENDVFNAVATSLRSTYSGIFVSGEKVAAPASYPFVSIVEADNFAYVNGEDSSVGENYANVMYEVEVITKKTSGKKSACKAIFSTLDANFISMGFNRVMRTPIPMDDAMTYKLVGRYSAVVSADKTIYRR